MLVKVVSSVFYVGLITLVVAQVVRSGGLQRALWAGTALAVGSPMGVRWLTDGMETSLVALMSVALPLIVYRAGASPSTSLRYAGLLVLGAALFLLRIEMLLLIAAASIGLWLRRLENRNATQPLGVRVRQLLAIALRNSGLLVGATACAVLVYIALGQLLPDAAVAKSVAGGDGIDALRRIGSSTASSLTLGVGLSAVWAASAVSAVYAAWPRRIALLSVVLLNAVIVVVAVGVAVRGQEVAGFRNMIWVLLFMVGWNIASAPATILLPEGFRGLLSWRATVGRLVLLGAIVLLAAAWVVEAYVVERIVSDRAQAYTDMRTQGLDRLSGLPGVAFDIGFVSYFTEGAICDLSGLVNGPEMASLSEDGRAARCAERVPVFAFVTPSQATFLHEYVDMSRWTVCYRYLFTNLRIPEPHYLLVEPSLAERMCPQSVSTYGEAGLG